MKNYHGKTKHISNIAGYMIGVVVWLIMIAICAVVCSYAVLNGSITEKTSTYLMCASIALASCVGYYLINLMLHLSPIPGVLYYAGLLLLLLIAGSILLLNGITGAMWSRGVCILVGTVSAELPSLVKKPKRKYRKMSSR